MGGHGMLALAADIIPIRTMFCIVENKLLKAPLGVIPEQKRGVSGRGSTPMGIVVRDPKEERKEPKGQFKEPETGIGRERLELERRE